MGELSDWLEFWRPIRAGFEQLSLQNPLVALCYWKSDGEWNALERIERELEPQDMKNESNPAKAPASHWALRMGRAGSEQLGSHAWWLLHEGLARAAQQSNAVLEGQELNRANRVCAEFENHADHAGNLLAQVPNNPRVRLPPEFAGFQSRKLWIGVLFGEADQPPNYSIRTRHYRPLWAESDRWPYGLRTLVANPFSASVVLIDIIRNAATAGDESLTFQRADATEKRPVWDADTGVLIYGGNPVRKYSEQAKNCRTVLSAFEECGWPARLDDPDPRGENSDRVHNTVDSLNGQLSGIEFSAGDGGTSYIWKTRSSQTHGEPTVNSA